MPLLVLNYIKLLFSLFLKATESDGWGCMCHAHNLNKQTLYSCTHLGAVRFKSYVTKRMNFTKFQITPPPPPHTPSGLLDWEHMDSREVTKKDLLVMFR